MDKLHELEQIAKKLDPEGPVRQAWLTMINDYAETFLNEIEEIPVYKKESSYPASFYALEISDTPKPMEELLEVLDEVVDKTGINPAGPSHMGYVPGGGVYPTALGDFLAAVTNRYAGIFYANPGSVRMENWLLKWMASVMGYPQDSVGNITSGGSIANLIGIVAARDFHEVTPENVRKSVIYMTSQLHHCILKALRIAGLNFAIVRRIDMDHNYHMDVGHLRDQIHRDKNTGLLPFLIIASAGTTDVGAIDPLDEIADIAGVFDCWFHVDAAYGGFFMLLDKINSKFNGLERSDSLVIDPHKGLFLSYGTGVVLVKNKEAVMKSHFYRANYMQDAIGMENEPNPADLSPELTKHFRGLRMWLSLQLFGLRPFKAALEEKILLCQYFYNKIQDLGFAVGPEPELSICIFRFLPKTKDPNTVNQNLLEQIKADGTIFLSSTTLDNQFWLRICIMVFRTHKVHVDKLLHFLTKWIGQKTYE
jgi:glutamate/tyrosine decarboxylase-like PLP-dependent enzyme